ncbi:MAG: hypothetical protein K0S45_1786 [Nitrospira sp.]|jgi:hypothetical protein|nr:hypothetical protein [Nitrospira sp.]
MWLRIGTWIELGMHIGSPDRRGEPPDRYLVHAAVRFGTTQWHYGPAPPNPTADPVASLQPAPQPTLVLHPEPELERRHLLWR